MWFYLFFFFKQKTAYEMRISDWSSDVCSSDLVLALGDSTYEYYCEAGKRLDRRLEELGATRLAPRVDCDVDYEEPAEGWSKAILDKLGSEAQPPTAPPALHAMAEPGRALNHKRTTFPPPPNANLPNVGRHTIQTNRPIPP